MLTKRKYRKAIRAWEVLALNEKESFEDFMWRLSNERIISLKTCTKLIEYNKKELTKSVDKRK